MAVLVGHRPHTCLPLPLTPVILTICTAIALALSVAFFRHGWVARSLFFSPGLGAGEAPRPRESAPPTVAERLTKKGYQHQGHYFCSEALAALSCVLACATFGAGPGGRYPCALTLRRCLWSVN